MDREAVIRSAVLALVVLSALPFGAVADQGDTVDRALGMPAQIDPDSVLLSIDVGSDGDAAWLIEYRVRLSNDNETEAFRSLQSDIEANENSYIQDFAAGIQSTVRNAENVTGRDMAASNFTVETRIRESVGQRYGIIAYRFSWSNFAVVEGDRIRAGDALSGFFLDSESTMIFSYPEEYSVVDAQPTPDERRENAVVWHGRLDFTSDEPRLIVTPAAGSTTADPGTTEPRQEGTSTLIPLAIGGLSVVLLLAAAMYLYLQRGDLDTLAGGPGETTEKAGAADTSGSGAAAAGGEVETEEATEEDTEPPEELLSNEERVKRFLRDQGGRAKQQEVVDAMGWTEAKTSQVVKKMRENDELESFRIGRENVLKLPDEDDEGEL